MRRPAFVVALLAGVAACVPDRPRRASGPVVDPSVPCAAEVEATLRSWGASMAYFGGAPARGAAVSYRFPTARLGHWVVAAQANDGSVSLTRVGSEGGVQRTYDRGCDATDRAAPAVRATVDASSGGLDPFDDEALIELLGADGPPGWLLYFWSPHMPLSVDGWEEASAAASARGLGSLPLLIDHADPDFAMREAERVGMPDEALRRVASIELVMRDAQLHAPSILVFLEGRVSPVLPGYRNAEGYERFLDAFLKPPAR